MKHWNEERHIAFQKILIILFFFFFLFRRTRKVAEGVSEVDCALWMFGALAAISVHSAHSENGFLFIWLWLPHP